MHVRSDMVCVLRQATGTARPAASLRAGSGGSAVGEGEGDGERDGDGELEADGPDPVGSTDVPGEPTGVRFAPLNFAGPSSGGRLTTGGTGAV